MLHVAADMKVAVNQVLGSTLSRRRGAEIAREQDHFVQEWLESVGVGVPGYVTPKVAIGAIVGNDDGELLLVQRADSKIWLYPTGWADVGYSPAEVAVKEVLEETGIEAEARRVVGVIDGQRMGFSRFGMYMLLFHCHAVGGELQCHPLECADVGWFARDALPEKTAGVQWWKDMAFDAIDGKPFDTVFDEVRTPDLARPVGERTRTRRRGRGRGGSARPRRRARRDRRRPRRSAPAASISPVTSPSSSSSTSDSSRLTYSTRSSSSAISAATRASYSAAPLANTSTGAGLPIRRHARSTSASAAFGDGIWAAYCGTAAHSDAVGMPAVRHRVLEHADDAGRPLVAGALQVVAVDQLAVAGRADDLHRAAVRARRRAARRG